MARQLVLQNLMKLAKSIGANPSKYMGTKTNITFLGKGPQNNPLYQSPIPGLAEEIASGRAKISDAMISGVEDAMGYATANKLNSIQLRALELNLKSLYEGLNPPALPSASVTAIRPGIEGLRRFPKESHKFMGRPLKRKDFDEIDQLIIEGKLPDARGRTWDFKTPKTGAGELPQKTASARATLYRLLDMSASKEGVGLTLREIMSKQDLKWLLEGGGGVQGDPIAMFAKYYGNASAKQLPTATTPAIIAKFAKQVIRRKDRMGRRIDDPYFSKEDLDFAGGGLAHILQVPKMKQGGRARFGEGKSHGVVSRNIGILEQEKNLWPDEWTEEREVELQRLYDLMGGTIDKTLGGFLNKPDEVSVDVPEEEKGSMFNPLNWFAKGGRAAYSKGRLVKSALAILNKNKKNAKYMFNASDNVSPGYAHGDIKYNAELLAEQLAEDAGVLFEDLGNLEQTKFYGTAYDYLAKEMGQVLLQKRMLRDIGQKMQLSDFSVKGRKPSASGGLAGILEV